MRIHKLLKRVPIVLIAMLTVFALGSSLGNANAAREYGGDYSKYQSSLYNNTGHDSFAISQMGGIVGSSIYDQSTYASHAAQAKARGWHFHSYIWLQDYGNIYNTQRAMNYFLSKVQAPYGSIVAIDFESGASGNMQADTNNVIYAMQMIKQAGFTPVLYSYKPFLQAHVNIGQVLSQFPGSLWIAGYEPGLNVWPNYGYFPSLPGVAIWQYSDYGGQQDLNVDLTGITNNGYGSKQGQAPNKSTPIAQPQQPVQKPQVKAPSHNQSNSQTVWYRVRPGDGFWIISQRLHCNEYALASVNGLSINSMIYPNEWLKVPGTGSAGVATSNRSANNNTIYYRIKYGDCLSTIAARYGISVYTLAAENGLSLNGYIYPNQVLKIRGSGGSSSVNSYRYYRVAYGNTLSGIAYCLGTSVWHLVSVNGIRNANLIYTGELLRY